MSIHGEYHTYGVETERSNLRRKSIVRELEETPWDWNIIEAKEKKNLKEGGDDQCQILRKISSKKYYITFDD